jgi:hypothetical protein
LPEYKNNNAPVDIFLFAVGGQSAIAHTTTPHCQNLQDPTSISKTPGVRRDQILTPLY